MEIARYLDAAVLKPEMTRQETMEAFAICLQLQTRTICVRPCDIPLAVDQTKGSTTDVCTVLAFPHGVTLTASKVDEARRYLELGVREIDMVANYGWIRSGLWEEVLADIASVTRVVKDRGGILKVIFETAQLAPDQIVRAVQASIEAGADFVKTSTGFGGEGARIEDVRLMLETADGRIQVKPSGGIRDRAKAELFLQMGATRLGVNFSSCPAICGVTPASSDDTGTY